MVAMVAAGPKGPAAQPGRRFQRRTSQKDW